VYHTLLCSWIWYFGAVAIVPFVLALAGYWAAAGALIGWLRMRGLSNPLLTAAVWVCADAAVERGPFGGFSWGEVGYALHNVSAARALASLGGLALVTFAVVALNGFIADLVVNRRARTAAIRAGIGVVLVFAVVVAANATRFEPTPAAPLRVALVQGNDKDRELTVAEQDARYLPKSHFALAEQITDPVDLIVFPESSMDADPRTDPYIHSHLSALARKHHAWVMANATVDADPEGKKSLNLNVLFDPQGNVVGTYAKRHLVPFGEYIPFRSLLSDLGVKEINKVPRDFKRGSKPGIFNVANSRLASVICFESAFGYQIRPLVHDGANVILVSTNNRSYRESANSAQHLAIGQMRAAETGRPVIQASISGISAIIDAHGNVHDRTKLFHNGVVESTVITATGQTLYVRVGEWVLWLSLLVVAVAIVLGVIRRFRQAKRDRTAAAEIVPVDTRIVGYELSRPKDEENV
jgi:apolipoprotein N-acyltransferase